MPRGDGTGPMGAGPMTGRALGYCAGLGRPGFAYGPNAGFGRGGGRGRRNRYYATGLFGWMRGGWGGAAPFAAPGAATERQFLEHESAALQARLDEIRQRLGELEVPNK